MTDASEWEPFLEGVEPGQRLDLGGFTMGQLKPLRALVEEYGGKLEVPDLDEWAMGDDLEDDDEAPDLTIILPGQPDDEPDPPRPNREQRRRAARKR